MKRLIKKNTMGLIAGAIAVSCGGFSVAAQESDDFLSGDFYYDYLFRETGVTPFKLHNLEDELGVNVYEYFGIDLPTESDYEEYLLYSDSEEYYNSGENGVSPQYAGIDFDYEMSSDNWYALDALAREGASDILLTKDCSTIEINHGHTALVYGNGMNVEHMGPKNNPEIPCATGYSQYVSMGRVWIHCKTCRLYEVPEARDNGIEEDIAEYARAYLTGKSYEILADVNDSNKVNCATLIWQAYNANGISLNHSANTCDPRDFILNNRFDMIFTLGWGSTNPYVW